MGQMAPERQGDLAELFGEMFDHLEDEFGIRVPRRRFFRDPFFRQLQQQWPKPRDFGDFTGFTGSGNQLELRNDDQGVRVETKERDDKGEVRRHVYQAPDLATFCDKYPVMAQRLHRHQPIRMRQRLRGHPAPAAMRRGGGQVDRLGVEMRGGLSADLQQSWASPTAPA